MAKSASLSFIYRISIFYRFALVFILGYLCTLYLSLSLTELFASLFAKAESIFLAAFISILFYVCFVLIGFCTNSLIKLTLISTILLAVLFGLSVGLS
ncbi:hypothetical protein [Acinetobacter haemolyticus]|uniref:Iron transporter n=1 Tax=Acinetobacter haemolyticus TaxID=29430 RepID=A0A857IKC8_ACIHA|nr:hypothetical protein [Acinetobacter haemolyticus]QHI10184.1 hypothetical protein AhaeAN59_08760 [Acinetobacter haemolyticus]QHI13449.1 hypothetical protein AhaeAN43_08695 [Acinetobacter haemolyticus]